VKIIDLVLFKQNYKIEGNFELVAKC